MPLENLKVDLKNPKNINPENTEDDDFDLVLEDDDFDPNLGLDDEDDDEDFEEVLEEEEEDDDAEEDNLEDGDDEEEDQEEPSRGPRENDRIRTLIEERNTQKELVRKAQEETLEVQKQMVELQKNTVSSTKEVLKNHVESLKSQMVKAHEDDDTTAYVDLQAKLNKAQTDLSALESWTPPETPEGPKEDSKENSQIAPPRAFTDWSNDNPWFQNPLNRDEVKMQREAIVYADILSAEGYSMETEEFFEKINQRLEQLGLAPKGKTNVESKNNDKNSSKGRKKKKISQTVQGGSRTPASKKKSNRNKVTLTAEQQNIARLMGMSNAEYAKELIRIEKAEQSGSRMTTLKID